MCKQAFRLYNLHNWESQNGFIWDPFGQIYSFIWVLDLWLHLGPLFKHFKKLWLRFGGAWRPKNRQK